MNTARSRTGICCGKIFAAMCVASASLAGTVRGDAVTSSQKDFPLEIGRGTNKTTIIQKRWHIENQHVRLAVIDDPGGAVVEFFNKSNGVNHVAGDVYKHTVNGKIVREGELAWNDPVYDDINDLSGIGTEGEEAEKSAARLMENQPYQVEILDGEGGAKTIKVTGKTAEQQVERWHTLKPGSPELMIRIKQTNISGKARRMLMRWHPYCFVSADRVGDSVCVLAPGENDQVRKIVVNSYGYDNWFLVHDGFWMAADYKSGDGMFLTYEKEKTPVVFVWLTEGRRRPFKGALTLEPYPEPLIYNAGESIEYRLSYYPFTRDTAPEAIGMGVLADKEECARARRFLQNAKPLNNMRLFGGYTFFDNASRFFPWLKGRRDIFGLREWGFADCAISGLPFQGLPIRVRMLGGVFDSATAVKPFQGGEGTVNFRITVKNQDNQTVYLGGHGVTLRPGVPERNYFDREISVPTAGMPDGDYTFRVEALDPVTGKPFHFHEAKTKVFGQRLEAETAKLESKLQELEKPRPFVSALAALPEVSVDKGRALIPIGVEDGSGTVRKEFPVRLGVPFPQGAFKSDAPARLLGPKDKPVPAQMRVMNVWPDKSLKWMQVDFQADCPADGYAFYKLDVGRGVEQATPAANLATETPESVEINTGAMLVRISRKSITIPGEVFLDRNGDGKYAEDERVMLPSQPGDAWWTDGTGCVYRLQLAGKDDGVVAPGVVVEQNGPQSAVVKMTGWYLDRAGRPMAIGEVRVEAFRGKKFFKLWHQVTFAGSGWRDQMKSYGLILRLKPGAYAGASYELDGRTAAAKGASALIQLKEDRAEIKAESPARGQKASGALLMGQGRDSALVYHRDFWRMYPKKMTADPAKGEVAVHYWPEEAGVHTYAPYEEFWMPSSSSSEACGKGASRVDEIVVDFSGETAAERAEAVYNEPVIVCTPPAWVFKTSVLNNLYPWSPEKNTEFERGARLTIDYYTRNRDLYGFYGHWNYGTVHFGFSKMLYNWWTVGRLGNIGNEEDIVQLPWLLYFRSGDRLHYKFAQAWTRFLMEVQSIRWHDVYPDAVGMSRRHHYTVWLGGGCFGHTMLCPWLEYYHAAGYYPAWEMAERTARGMAAVKGGHWRAISNPLCGNIRMYLETGDEKYKAVADKIWKDYMTPDRNEWWEYSHGSRMCTWYARFNDECMKAWQTWSLEGRNGAKELQYPDTFGALGDLTGNLSYAHAARKCVDTAGQMMHGVNAAFRGFTGTMTQAVFANLRALLYALGQAEKSEKIFPAKLIGLPGDVLVMEDKDAEFTVWISGKPETIKILAPDNKPAELKVEKAEGSDEWLVVRVQPDQKTGCYRILFGAHHYFGCSLKNVAILAPATLNSPGTVPLYVRASDLGPKQARVFMEGAAPSLELFAMDGKMLFAKSHVRPLEDAVAIEHVFALPDGAVLRLGDRNGVTFPDLMQIPLYLNPDGIFDLPGPAAPAK